MRLQIESHDLVPEEVIVLETVGTIENFVRAVEQIPGMEWLAEIESEDIVPDEDFFELSKKGEPRRSKPLGGRLFMVFLNQDALQQMLSLWKAWQEGGRLARGQGPWRAVFRQLHDVRVWGPKDRLHETGVLDDWRDRVARGDEVVPCEIEIWHRGTLPQRREARDRVAGLVDDRDGRVISEVALEEIAYHALLVQLPVVFVESLLDGEESNIALVQCEQIQFFRAGGQMAVTLGDDGQEDDRADFPDQPVVGTPVVGLFDGLPLQAHRRLVGRLVVDDPDGVEEDYPATRRRHGTAMASLVLHGDLAAGERPLPRPLYVRPILRPDPRDWYNADEVVAESTLVVDLVQRAVRRMFEGEAGEPAAAPNVAVINLSIGIRDRPFDHALSPLARLLDWLAWRYKVLFVVSAGNHPQRIELASQPGDLRSMSADQMQGAVIRSVISDGRNRRLLSPAESVNALTVGAVHEDASAGPTPPRWRDPYHGTGLPSPINAQGLGYRRAIKPDLLTSGGRVVVQEPLEASHGGQAELDIYRGTLAPGQLVAAPGAAAGGQTGARHTRGTSNAAALVSRAAGWFYEVLEELREGAGGEMIDNVPRAVWLKALVAHGADWKVAGDTLGTIFDGQGNSRQVKAYVTRLLGYGAVEFDRVRECTATRVTAISAGALDENTSHVHRFPLPPSLNGWRGYRRLAITLAWISPVNPRHRSWRRAQLWFSPPKRELSVDRIQADWQTVQRGTLQHEILEGESAGEFVQGANLEIQVSCRPDAGVLEERIPYALVTTVEVASDLWVSNIYDEVRAAVHAAHVRVTTAHSDVS